MYKSALLLGLMLIISFGKQLLAKSPDFPLTVLQHVEQSYNLGDQVAILEDTTAGLTITDVTKLDALFKPSQQQIPVYGSTASTIWCAFRIQNHTKADWFLEIDTPYLTQIDLYQAQPGGIFNHLQVGASKNFEQRYVKANTFILPLRVPTGEQRFFYLRLESNSILRFPLRVATMQQLYENNHRKELVNGFFYGIMLTLMLYNLFVFISIKDRTYLYYVLYLIFMVLNTGYIRGHGLEFLFSDFPQLNQTNFFSAFSMIAAVLFTNSFLRVKQTAPRWLWPGYLLISLAFTNLLFSIFLSLLAGFKVQTIASAITVFYVLSIGIYFFRRGFAPARFYLLGFGFLAVGLFIYALKDNGFLNHNAFTDTAMQIGAALEAVILSFALANKLNVYKQEKEEIQTQALQQASSFSQQLLQTQEQERKRIAAELHDSVGQSLILMKNRILLLKNQVAAPEKTMGQLDTLSESLTHTIQEVRSISYGLRPFQLDLLGLTQSIRSLTEEVSAAAQLPLTEDIQPIDGLFPKDWEINIYRIIQECLNNLVKHANATCARLAVYQQADQVEICLEDNGRGLSPIGTLKPDHTGFGLLGIQERLKIMTGTICYKPVIPHGTNIFISIPIPHSRHEPA